jgi:hypothetical protein
MRKKTKEKIKKIYWAKKERGKKSNQGCQFLLLPLSSLCARGRWVMMMMTVGFLLVLAGCCLSWNSSRVDRREN